MTATSRLRLGFNSGRRTGETCAACWGMLEFRRVRLTLLLFSELRLAMAGCGVSKIGEIDGTLIETDFP